jgi:predicted amidohydrolase
MSRFAAGQPDLFAPAAAPEPASPPGRPPLEELAEILARLRATEHLPWPTLNAAMAAEQHFLGLARMAGAEGKVLAAAIMDETERLFAADEQAAARACAPVGS